MLDRKHRRRIFAIYWSTKLIPIVLALVFISCTKDTPEPIVEEEIPVVEIVKPFNKVPGLNEMVIYEVNFMAFGPDCNLAAVEEKLDHIKDLGVNVIWLMPIFPEGIENGVGSPYSVQNYTEINPDLGNLNDFKKFVEKAHQNEMAVIIDWVANHTSWDNDWIYNFDWYVSDASGNIIIPPGTNWQDVAELDYSSQAMRLEMIKSLKFWVDECNIDGFRFDAVDFVPADFWKQAIDSLSTYTDRNLILLAEGGNVKTMDAGFQMLYAWDFQTKLKHIFGQNYAASEIFQVNKNELSGLTEGKTRLRYITNHDIYAWEESPVESFQSKEGTLAAFAIASFLDGVPLICSGQEIAHPQTISFFGKNPLNWSINPEILLGYKDLMDIRTKEIKLLQGKLTEFKHNDVCCFSKTTENGEILVMVNVRNSNVSFPVPSIFISQEWSDLTLNASINFENKISLKAYEYRIFKSN